MATTYVKLRGTITYAKVFEPDTYLGQTAWKLNLSPLNAEEWKKFEDSGIQKKIKDDENGKFFPLKRDTFKLIKGELVNFTGPIVEYEDGSVMVDYVNKETQKRVYSYPQDMADKIVRRGKPVSLGNGSEVTVDIAVYDTQKGKGHRVEKITVHNLVEYIRDEKLPEVREDVTAPFEVSPHAPVTPPKSGPGVPW